MRKLKPKSEYKPGIAAISMGSLPPKIEEEVRRRVSAVLARDKMPEPEIAALVERLIEETTHAFLLDGAILPAPGRGKPRDAARDILSALVSEILAAKGLRGNTLGIADDEDDIPGTPGLVSELESIVMTARDQAVDSNAPGVAARPARISNARKLLGKITLHSGR